MSQGQIRSDLPVERILDTIGGQLYGTMFTNHFIGRLVSLDEQYQSILTILLKDCFPAEHWHSRFRIQVQHRPDSSAARGRDSPAV